MANQPWCLGSGYAWRAEPRRLELHAKNLTTLEAIASGIIDVPAILRSVVEQEIANERERVRYLGTRFAEFRRAVIISHQGVEYFEARDSDWTACVGRLLGQEAGR